MAARRQVTRVAQVAAAPEVVWRRLVEPGGLARWLGGGHGIDLRDVRDGRVVFWWRPDGEEASEVEITLAPADGGTRVTVTETVLADLAPGCVQGSGHVRPEAATQRREEALAGGRRA